MREQLAAERAAIGARFWQDEPIEDLMFALADAVDNAVTSLFRAQFGESDPVTLYAVGGYGRRELHPGSDIDLLLVATKPEKYRAQIEQFLQDVFDLNLEVGHAVRDLKSCKQQVKNDITVATAMFERRQLAGDEKLAQKLDTIMNAKRLWPIDQFFKAKLDEQEKRHRDYDNVEYNLEPNVKTSPGGLRDIHTALWICRRQFGATEPEALRELGVLTDDECKWLDEGRRFIWWVRFGLHLVAERKEDHLQFAHQRELAQRLGFADTDAQLGVERFMHHYYRHVLALREVNDILIQYFNETIIKRRRAKPTTIDSAFHLIDNYIEAIDSNLFDRDPSALLQLFVVMAGRNDIAGVRVSTIRAVREHLHLIDDDFRANPKHAKLFIELLKAPYTLVSTLTRMRRYGVLGRYIPEYGQVIGQMQHDLFHIYTVDAHTMMVIRNMRRFRYRSSQESYPIAYHCVHSVPKIELLYIAGLYHDIGKGRGGDHSELGANDARAFCQRHGLSTADTDLVCWLVEKHLYMSTVSQRQDIYDPDVVLAFAEEVKSEMRLDYLYALTVADINATNPTLWNSWRATLLRQLFTETRRFLRRGLESQQDRAATIIAHQERAMEKLGAALQSDDQATPPEQHTALQDQVRSLWAQIGDDFFLRHPPRQIVELTRTMLAHDPTTSPLVLLQGTQGDLAGEGATRVYVYSADRPQLFARTVVALSDYGLTVVDATVNTTDAGICFDMFTVLTNEGEPLELTAKLRDDLIARVVVALQSEDAAIQVKKRRLSRRLRELPNPTEVTLEDTGDGLSSTLTIIANDRPGLLAVIGQLFAELNLNILSAKIATLGERVEDTFTIQGPDGQPISSGEAAYTLQQTIRQRLDTHIQKQSA